MVAGVIDSQTENQLMALAAKQTPAPSIDASPPHQGCCIHAVNGVELVMDPQGVAYWPAEQTLLVADLHLEKGSSFARKGQMLPPYDTTTTLDRLGRCVEKWQPQRVIALGDSFHDPHAPGRLSDAAIGALSKIMMGRDWIWITGNHDPLTSDDAVMKQIGGALVSELTYRGLILRHEPETGTESGEIAGHLHPKARLIRRGRSIRRSCFAVNQKRAILPSFGAYTGGLNVFDPAFDGLFEDKEFHALMRGDNQVYRIAATELRR